MMMESGGEGPAIADGVIADSFNVIYLVEDIKPDVSNLLFEGVDKNISVKKEEQEDLLHNAYHNDVKIEDFEVGLTIKHENLDNEKSNESNFDTNQTLLEKVNGNDLLKSEQCGILSSEEFGCASSNQNYVKKFNIEKPFQCSYCDKAFSHSSKLKIHERIHTGEKPFNCEYCDKAFCGSYQLKRHLRIHTGDKPFKCNYCDKAFYDSSNLRVHEKIHSSEKSFICNFCDKGFSSKYNLVIHIRVHTGEKPLKCIFCDKTFSDAAGLKRHQKVHTGDRPFKCKYCDRGLSTKYSLGKHVKAIHKQLL